MGRFGIEITKSRQRKDELSGRTKEKGKLLVSKDYILLDIPAMAANNVGFRTAFLLVCTYLDTRTDVHKYQIQGHPGSAIKFIKPYPFTPVLKDES